MSPAPPAPSSAPSAPRVLALTGGIGGAKLCLGLQRVLPPGALTAVVNTGDDFVHFGLTICPDLDTTLYTLAGVADPVLGWGRRDDTSECFGELGRLGGESWFRLNDRDLALHLDRSGRLAAGEALSRYTADLARRFDVPTKLLPMSDDPVRTVVDTDEGRLEFQHYFVRRRCEPRVREISYEGAERARPPAGLGEAVARGEFDAIVLCPSNPWLSVAPLLSMPSLRAILERTSTPIVAVSPIVGGAAVKGPTAKIMRELGFEASAVAVARHYAELIDGFVLDERDRALAPACAMPTHVAQTVMRSLDDREHLAREVLAFAARLRNSAAPRRRVAT